MSDMPKIMTLPALEHYDEKIKEWTEEKLEQQDPSIDFKDYEIFVNTNGNLVIMEGDFV